MDYNNFYPSSLYCNCGNNITKSVFHKEATINVSNKIIIPFERIFTCKQCMYLIIPFPGFAIEFNNFFLKKCYNLQEYNYLMEKLNKNGSTYGRNNSIFSQALLTSIGDDNNYIFSRRNQEEIKEICDQYGYSENDIISFSLSGIKLIEEIITVSFAS